MIATMACYGESQKGVLLLLQRAGAQGVARTSLVRAYEELGRRYPELCDGILFVEWLHWAEEEGLISCISDRVVLAEKGRFILYDLKCNEAFADHRCV
jgi:hypothetical protein